MLRTIVAALFVIGGGVGCGDVSSKKMIDAQVVTNNDAAVVDSAPADTAIDAGLNCMVDNLDGAALQSHWTTTQGSAPTYTVSGGLLQITESTIASTPSNTDESWINDLDTDKGNQLGWAQAIGAGDFVLKTEVNWTGTTGELHIAAVGVADASGTIVAMAGAYDGGQSFDGIPYARLWGVGSDADVSYGGSQEEPGTADFRIERTGSTVKFFVDNAEVLSGTNSAVISHVVIIHVPYRLNTTTYAYGTGEITRVEICR